LIAVARSYLGQIAGTKIARLFGFSRADLYRNQNTITDRNQALRDEIHAIALDFPVYGYRNIAHELRRRGWTVNMKRVLRIMRMDGLCARRRKSRGLPYHRHGLAT
jgi:putative transposase